MITKFETASQSSAGKSGGSNALLYIIGGAILLYLGYTYIIKPEMEKRKAEEKKA